MKAVEVNRTTLLELCSLDLFDYQLDPYAGCAHHCVYCYTRNGAPLDWDAEVGVMPDLEERLTAELADIPKQTIYMGMNTDPCQPVEKDPSQTRLVLEALGRAGGIWP